MDSNKTANRLFNEKSPYLLQHAYNPVDWYPWGDEAFEKASTENKPIFLSIGYSTCHWCHVMEHESFENSTVAALMNEVFISIKVDREERPDIDNIYMTVCQLITGHGGWPLTIIMTPDKKPFFAGTYFPKESRGGRIGMFDLVNRVKEIWASDRDKIDESSEKILEGLLNSVAGNNSAEISEEVLTSAVKQFLERYDSDFGGFGNAPKFPSPHNLMLLLKMYHYNKDEQFLKIVEKTLTEMRKGGIFDQIGFGFHRYSTDRHWLLPHFEKMLYDQAMLILAYTETYQITKNDFYKSVSEEIIEYVLRDMTSPKGGFYSAEDADSEGEEGKFYVWSFSELESLLDKKDLDIFTSVYNIKKDGNFIDEASRQQSIFNIPHKKSNIKSISDELNIELSKLEDSINTSIEILFAEREKRIHPLKDDKVLTDWNGLMIAALAKAGRTFENKTYINAAEKAANFILTEMVDDSGKLIHRYRDGEFDHQANLDDYAFTIWGLLELYHSNFKADLLQKTIKLNSILQNHFWDADNGGYFFTPDYGEKLLIRQKDLYDGAIPSGNSVQLNNLVTLGKITANTMFTEFAKKQIKTFGNDIKNSPSAYSHFLTGFLLNRKESSEIIIVGDKNSDEVNSYLQLINSVYNPNRVVLLIDENDKEILKTIAPYTSNYTKLNQVATVYVCKNYECKLPVTEIKELKSLLYLN